jgi:hypothetical protein
MSNSFPKNHSAKKITRRCFAVIVVCFMALAAFPLYAETPMPASPNPYFTGENKRPEFFRFLKPTRYEQALKEETPNGLIALDFRGLKKPGFLTHWPDKDIWKKDWAYNDYVKEDFYIFKGIRGYYRFRWGVDNSKNALDVATHVCKDYELAHALFLLDMGSSSSMYPLPYVECKKRIGTFCMSAIGSNKTMFFFYKNVAVTIKNATDDQFAEQFADWLSDVLKGFPLIPINAPLQFRREPYSTPVFEYLGSEAPAAGDSSRMGAGGGDDDN